MKKILLPILTICCMLLSGCTATTTTTGRSVSSISSSHKYLRINAGVMPTPVIADLAVLDQKVSGEASGLPGDAEFLKREATAKALRMDPPKPEGPDLLVAREEYTEVTNGVMKVTVTGYPAWYRNIRKAPDDAPESTWLIITSSQDLQPTKGK